MEFDAISYYQQNAKKLKIRESTSYGIHMDEESNVIVSCTDFGHIHLYYHDMSMSAEDHNINSNIVNSSGTNGCGFNKKTIHTDTPPIFASQLATISNSKILLCGGNKNNLRGYLWDTLMGAAHNSILPASFEFNSGCDGTSESESNGNIISIACVSQHNLVYAANDKGRIYCYNTLTGSSSLTATSRTIALRRTHASRVHTLCLLSTGVLLSCDSGGLVCSWDASDPGTLLSRSNIIVDLAQALGAHQSCLWISSMDVDTDGNFLYVGGGKDAPCSSDSLGSKARNTFHRPSSGWLASFLLTSTVGDSGGHFSTESATTLIQCTPVAVPIQTLHLRGTELVSGGAQPLLTFWKSHNLAPVSSMETSSQTIFAIASYDSARSGTDVEAKLLAVGGTLPVVDLISVIGHKEAVLCPL